MQPSNHTPPNRIYSVSRLTADIKSLLEQNFPFVWITGEISNFSVPVSGHYYFTLKDDHAQISAVMFRGQNRNLKFKPANGMNVTGLGRVSVYEPRGSYQAIFEFLEPKGIGAIQVAFEQLKAQLAAEGLFDDAHKRPLPYLPRKISVITSPTGAVVHDIIKIIRRRFESVHIEIVPVNVQGDEAATLIVAALELLNRRNDADVIILARGGGSIEDMAAFNTEAVARAIFSSTIPVISAIGHETDFTIADFVSDLRAPTPSAAAELVVPVKQDLVALCRSLETALTDVIYKYMDAMKRMLAERSRRLADPGKKIADHRFRIDELTARLVRWIGGDIRVRKDKLALWHDRLDSNTPLTLLKKVNEKLDNINSNLLYHMKIYLNNKNFPLREATARLQALNPKAILNRGYSITRTIPDKIVVRDDESVRTGQNLEILLAKGALVCRVEGKSAHDQENI